MDKAVCRYCVWGTEGYGGVVFRDNEGIKVLHVGIRGY